MAYCIICGDEDKLTSPRRFWDCDDGWKFGRFCPYCLPHAARKPRPTDYAYDQRGEYVSNVDNAIDQIYG